MAHRGVRVALLMFAAALFAGAGYRLVDLERRVAATVEEARQIDLQVQEAGRQIAEIKSAQAAYVAAGQGRDYWPARVATLLRAVTAGLETLSGRVAEDEASRAALDESRKSITRFARLDSRAREYVSESQLLMASDVIFAEGLELLSATASHLDQAREHQRQARDRRNADARRLEMYTIAATGGLALLIMLLLVPAGRREAESEAADATARVV
ncbi:MAG: hypothetical protein HY654_13140, partial [Acidobacteria bacterium]|nr:hypothetical protein [Acidobacteriota bacterium]